MRILKAGLLVAVLLLVASPAVAATQYYVRTDGNDAQCNGRYNQAYTTGPDCAFASPQRAFDLDGVTGFENDYVHPETGDDLRIAAGTYGRLVIPADFTGGIENDRTVISGDPAVSRLLVRIEAGAGDQEAILIESQLADPTEHVTIQHLSFKAGTKKGIYAAKKIHHVAFTDLEGGPSDFANICCTTNQNDSAAVIRVGDSNNTGSTDVQVAFSRFTAPTTMTEAGIQGTDASVFVLHVSESRIREVEASHFLGAFAAEISHSTIVENNTISNTACSDFDGCIFSYNDHDVLIRRNVMHMMRPGSQMPAIKLRRNPAEMNDVEAYVYNNTLIGAPNISDGSPNVGMNFFMPTGSSANSTRAVFLNNIVMNLGNPSGSSNYAVVLAHCPTAQREVDYNNFWNNAIDPNTGLAKNFLNSNSAPSPCASETFNANSFSYNPQLSVAFQPPSGHPLCGAGWTGFTAEYDGDTSSSYVGAKPCPAGGGGGGCHPFCYED